MLSLKRPEGNHSARPTARVIEALSRYDETPARLVIEKFSVPAHSPSGGLRAEGHQQQLRQPKRSNADARNPGATVDAVARVYEQERRTMSEQDQQRSTGTIVTYFRDRAYGFIKPTGS